MNRTIQIDDEVLMITWTEQDGRVTLGEMRIIPAIVYRNFIRTT